MRGCKGVAGVRARVAGGAWGPRWRPLSPGARGSQWPGPGEAQLGWVLGARPRRAPRCGTFLASVFLRGVGDGEETEAQGTGRRTMGGGSGGRIRAQECKPYQRGPLPSPDTRTLQRSRSGGRGVSFCSLNGSPALYSGDLDSEPGETLAQVPVDKLWRAL